MTPASRQLGRQQPVEGAARLEAAGVLEELQLQRDRHRRPQLARVEPQHRRAADMPRDMRRLAISMAAWDVTAWHGRPDAGTWSPPAQPAFLSPRAAPHCRPDADPCELRGPRSGAGVLLLGPPGSGKSDLVLRLLERGFMLVADDRVEIEGGIARPPPPLAGLLEVRGLGIVRPAARGARRRWRSPCASGRRCERLPMPARDAELGLPVMRARSRPLRRPRRGWRWRSTARSAASTQIAGAFRMSERLSSRSCWSPACPGAGKASVLRALEDLGYEAVDNPPLPLVDGLVAGQVAAGARGLAIGIDARTSGFDAGAVLATRERLRAHPALRAELVYAWADDGVLMRRYTESRRRHPLAPEGRVRDGIAAEQALTGAAARGRRPGDRHLRPAARRAAAADRAALRRTAASAMRG